jgi:hypothetical protein
MLQGLLTPGGRMLRQPRVADRQRYAADDPGLAWVAEWNRCWIGGPLWIEKHSNSLTGQI